METQGFENLVKELENCRCDFVITNYYEVNDATKARKEKSFRQIPGKKVLNIREVLEKAQQGRRILDRTSGCYIAHRQVGNVTFWVYFREKESGVYEVVRAYSHRMTITGEGEEA